MNAIQSLHNIVGLRTSEGRPVGILFLSLFLQGGSMALLFTVAISLFLKELPVQELPVVYMITTVFLWLGGWFYTAMEHRLSQARISYIIIAIVTGSMLLLRFGLHISDEAILLYVLIVFFYFSYLLFNLDFWGKTALHYDIRESKRLFALISAGDIPAKLLGYLAALILITKIGTDNLLFLAAGLYLVSAILVKPSIAKRVDTETTDHNLPAGGLINSFKSDGLVRQSALVSLFSTAAYIVVSFILYGYIKHEYQDEVSLAMFIAALLSVGYIIKMIVMIFLTRRLHQYLGLRSALLITPIILLLLGTVAFGTSLFFRHILALYFFGAMAILADILRSAIQYPVLMASMQVLPVNTRMAGHAVVKGLMDPFAYLIIGAILFFAPSHGGIIDFRVLGLLLLIVLTGGIIVSIPINQQYLNSLSNAIRMRSLKRKTIQLESPEVLARAIEVAQSGDFDAVIFLLRVMDPDDPNWQKVIRASLAHPSKEARKSALSLMEEQQETSLSEVIKNQIRYEQDPEIIHLTLRILVKKEGPDVLTDFFKDGNSTIRFASFSLLLQFPEHHGYMKAKEIVKKLLLSESNKNKLSGLDILAKAGKNEILPLHPLLTSSDQGIKFAAIATAGKTQDASTIGILINFLSTPYYYQDSRRALLDMGNVMVQPVLEAALNSQDYNLRQNLIGLLASHKSEVACNALYRLLDKWPNDMGFILSHLVKHNRASLLKGRMNPFITLLLNRAERLYCLNQSLKAQERFYLLAEGLSQEMIKTRNYLLWCYYLNSADARLKKTFVGLATKNKEMVASSIELLENVCGREVMVDFLRLYEPMPDDERINQMRSAHCYKIYNPKVAITEILSKQKPAYSEWLQALALYSMLKYPELRIDHFPSELQQCNSAMVRELATQLT